MAVKENCSREQHGTINEQLLLSSNSGQQLVMEAIDRMNQSKKKKDSHNNMLGTKWTINKYFLDEWMKDFRERSVFRVDQKDLLGRTELRKDSVLLSIACWTCHSLSACRRFYTSIHLRQHTMVSNQGDFLTSTFYNPFICTILRFCLLQDPQYLTK